MMLVRSVRLNLEPESQRKIEFEFDLSIYEATLSQGCHDTHSLNLQVPYPDACFSSLSLTEATSAACAWRQLAMRKCSIFSNNLQAFNQARFWTGTGTAAGIGSHEREMRDAALIDQNPCGRRMLWQPRSIPSFMRSAALSAVRHQAMLKEPNLTNNVDPCPALPPPLLETLSCPLSLTLKSVRGKTFSKA